MRNLKKKMVYICETIAKILGFDTIIGFLEMISWLIIGVELIILLREREIGNGFLLIM